LGWEARVSTWFPAAGSVFGAILMAGGAKDTGMLWPCTAVISQDNCEAAES
jgi:hypothetical protein